MPSARSTRLLTERAAAAPTADPVWAWAPYEPSLERPWNLRWAGHLFRRAAFGGTWDELGRAVREGPGRTIERLMAPADDVAAFNERIDAYESPASDAGSADALRSWWLRRILETPHPLLERMTLFWHTHFAVSSARVKRAICYQRFLRLLRAHALDRFDVLLGAVVREPAFFLGLDAEANRKARPTEHLGREFLRSFTVGPDAATDADAREVARAFTGHFVYGIELKRLDREHDTGVKTILGKAGAWSSEDAVRIAVEHPATARHVVRKLYRCFIAEDAEPSDDLLAPLVHGFAQDRDIKRVVETMLRSNLFFSDAAYRRRVKSPVEFAIGVARGLAGVVPTQPLAEDLASLGQNICHPPTVLGWPGGRAWITDATLIQRSRLAMALLDGSDRYGGKLDPRGSAAKAGRTTPAEAARFLIDLCLQDDLAGEDRAGLLGIVEGGADGRALDADRAIREVAHAVVTVPEFHLA